MAIAEILLLGNPRLRATATAVPERSIGSAALNALIKDLVDTMRANDGAGLAAPQIGVALQVCIIEVKANPRYPAFPEIPLCVLINPQLTPLSQGPDGPSRAETVSIYEGCLSVPGLRGRVTRPRRVRVEALDPTGATLDSVWEGISAAIVQHEVDHLQGTLFVDRVEPRTLCLAAEYARYVPMRDAAVDHAEPK